MIDLEYAILDVTSQPISKTETWRQVGKLGIKVSKETCYNKIDDMIDMGYLLKVDSKKKNVILVQRVDTEHEQTWQSVFLSQKEFLENSVKELSKHKKLLKSHKSNNPYPMYTKLFLPTKRTVESMMHFSMAIDYLMITQIRAKYMYYFGMNRKGITENRIQKIDNIIQKGISKLYAEHPNEKMKIRFWIRQTNRDFANLLI